MNNSVDSTAPARITEGFHVTTDKSLSSILRDGLVPAIGVRSTELGEALPAIYMFPSVADLEDALGNWLGECFEDYDGDLHILQVDLTNVSIDQEVKWELKSYEPIDPRLITYLRPE